MLTEFDPYHKWLGIPPDQQPPNYYKLLGLEEFESDHDVITNVADQRMKQIKTYQTGRRAVDSNPVGSQLVGRPLHRV